MHQRIKILKGSYDKIRISDSTFPLLAPLDYFYGKAKATVDASSLLGEDFKIIQVDVEDYVVLD